MRNRTVGCKVTESEYEKLAGLATQEGQRLGEWARAVLLERAEGRVSSGTAPANCDDLTQTGNVLDFRYGPILLGRDVQLRHLGQPLGDWRDHAAV